MDALTSIDIAYGTDNRHKKTVYDYNKHLSAAMFLWEYQRHFQISQKFLEFSPQPCEELSSEGVDQVVSLKDCLTTLSTWLWRGRAAGATWSFLAAFTHTSHIFMFQIFRTLDFVRTRATF